MFICDMKIIEYGARRKLELRLVFHGWNTNCMYDHEIDSALFVLK